MVLDVFGLGQCADDHLLCLPRSVGPDDKVEGHDLVRACGGPVATALVALTRWGRRCAFAGVIGDDASGRAIRADLAAEGVDTNNLLERPGSLSQQAFIGIHEEDGRRQILWQRPTGAPPTPAEIRMPAARFFLTDGLHAEASLACAHAAKRVIVDAGSMREGTRALLDCAEVFVASRSFARDLVGSDDPDGACRVLHEHGVRIAGVTLGAEGYVASWGGSTRRREAWPAEVVDTTGCGDIFHAGLVEGLLAGFDEAVSFEFAAWAAAACATAVGGRAGLPRSDVWPGPRATPR